MTAPVIVHLDAAHLAYAEEIGRQRRLTRKGTGSHGCDASMAGDGFGEDRIGAGTETAFSLWLRPGQAPRLSVGTYRSEPDFPRTELRGASFGAGSLIHRQIDRTDYAYVLAVPFGGSGAAWRFPGWLWGHECRNPWWWYEDNGRPGAWFVPQAVLRPMSTYRAEVLP